MVVPIKENTVTVECFLCARDTSFEVPASTVVHLDETGTKIVYYASCRNSHLVPVDSDGALLFPEARAKAEAYRDQVKSNLARIAHEELPDGCDEYYTQDLVDSL